MWLMKIPPNICVIKSVCKKYLEDICYMKGWSDKKAILSFISRHNLTALHTKFHICQTPPSRFFFKNNLANI